MLEKNATAFQAALLDWYRRNARRLPWRLTSDPYKIWVSEIMLQQTQAAAVIPYYERWLKRFPAVEPLAKAPLSEVLKLWAGLGYYRRARMLHKAAGIVFKNYAGQIPKSAGELLKLPGIGRYTAGAVASIAFGERAPVLDGNVIRILTRLEAVGSDIGEGKTIQKLWKLAGSLVPAEEPGDFNQAMMELGATVCLPENPKCDACPVSDFCRARALRRPGDFPVKGKKETTEALRTAALIYRKSGKVMIRRQPEEARWGGLWMFPFSETPGKLAGAAGVSLKDLKRRMTIRHGFTRYRVKLEVYEHEGARGMGQGAGISKNRKKAPKEKLSGRPEKRKGGLPLASFPLPLTPYPLPLKIRWVKIKDLPKYAFPSPHQKIAAELLKENDHAL